MNGLDKLNLRLGYYGGDARSRLQGDKLHSLQKALLYSYQAETIALRDKREFRCLINTNKNTDDYDDKILSVPFEGICLNNNSCCCCDGGNSAFKIEEATNIEEGDVIT